ncbi:MAG: hypothetical protein K0S32_3789 [Bacteroidetes bacterium]|nr:hypothetical protein [Bacteroidota bacterium]
MKIELHFLTSLEMKIIFTLTIFVLCAGTNSGQTSVKQIVFTTDSFKDSKTITINGIASNITTVKKCDESNGPPYDCHTTITFSKKSFPSLKVHGDAYMFAKADINQDGKEELILKIQESGTWRDIEVYALSASKIPSWYMVFDRFMWYPGWEEKACPAKIYWMPDKKQVQVYTTSAAKEGFPCDGKTNYAWKNK